jgi:hypothetical protein
MMKTKYNLAESIVGLIIGFEKNSDSKTGFRIKMLVKGAEMTFDAAEEVYNIQFSDEFFPYPCLGEIIFLAATDDKGVVTELVNVNNILAKNNPIQTGYVMGTCRMFEVKITNKTPRVSDILTLRGNTVTFTNFNKYAAEGAICHSVNGGTIPPAADGVSFKLAPDVNVYTWDWTTSLVPFSRCSREEAKARRFVTRFLVGSLDDIQKNCYWVGFYSTRGNENECDLIKCFLNAPPGWE